PLWTDAAAARAARALLAAAADDGLDPADYAVSPAADAAGQDSALTRAVLRFLSDLHFGRVDPRSLGFRLPPRPALDLAARLREAVAQGGVAQLADQLRPPFAVYGRLRAALPRYRALAAETPVPLPAVTRVRAGEHYAGAAALRQRLVALGDLPADAAPGADASLYDTTLAEGVARFQRRHGLAADGVLGRATLAALAVPPAARVRQIELALERLRWLPRLDREPFVAINIALFRLWAWDPAAAATPLEMGVIVGRALKTQTPVFVEQMRYLIFRPYWNVPRSIVRGEILPALARNPRYLSQHDMEIVRGPGDDATPVAASADSVAALARGALRLRQRPGPENSLGLVKFIFPNDANVYLHGTPAPQLFGRARRDFSHGCVRVEDPLALAQWVLRDQPQWSRERIEAAMAGPASNRRVDLGRPLTTVLFYMTATVLPGSGALQFAEDIYGHDAALERRLAARR
ncbi:MAG TPA: L,D-transpeptidase family protein, partial [Burkholderiaceae bacterium]